LKIYTFLPCCLLPLCCFSLNCFSYNVYICYLVLIQFNIFSNNCIIYTFISLLFYLTSLRLYNKRGFFGCKFYHHILYICWKSTQNKVKQPNRVRKTNNCINSIWFSCVFKMKKRERMRIILFQHHQKWRRTTLYLFLENVQGNKFSQNRKMEKNVHSKKKPQWFIAENFLWKKNEMFTVFLSSCVEASQWVSEEVVMHVRVFGWRVRKRIKFVFFLTLNGNSLFLSSRRN
jgi:hypothetical protein